MESLRGPARAALGREVAEDDAGDPEQRRLGQRDHAAVGGEEDQARGGDPEKKRLDQDLVRPVRAEDPRRARRRRGSAQRPRARAPTAACASTRSGSRRPSRTGRCGRNASTSAISTKVRIDRVLRAAVGARGRQVRGAEVRDEARSRIAPAAAPKIDPIPPTITTTSELSSHWPSWPEEMFDCDAQTTAPNAASAEPTTNAIAKVFWMLTPSAEVICSVVDARPGSPSPSSSGRARATDRARPTTPIASITSRAREYDTPPMWRSRSWSVHPGQVRSTALPPNRCPSKCCAESGR